MGTTSKKDVLCFSFLCLSVVTVISFMVSSIALFRNVYIAEHQQEIQDLLEAYLAAQSQMHAQVAPVQQEPTSIYDSYLQKSSSSVQRMTSFSVREEPLYNGTFVLPDYAIKIDKNTYLIGEKSIDMNEYNRKRGIAVNDELEPDIQTLQIMVHVYWEKDYQPEEYESVQNEATTCYTFNAVGAYWKSREDYILGTSNTEGLSDSQVDNSVRSAIDTWQVNIPNHQVIGSRIVGGVPDAVIGNEPNGKNELIFGSISTRGVIAVTITFGIFAGDVSNRKIVEWKMILNQVDYNFGDASVNPSKMDLLSILTHEFGHVFGLGDIYATACKDVTMYGYSSEGQTGKRTLSSSDITGIKTLYNEITQAAPPAPAPSTSPRSSKKKKKKKKSKKNREETNSSSVLKYSLVIQVITTLFVLM